MAADKIASVMQCLRKTDVKTTALFYPTHTEGETAARSKRVRDRQRACNGCFLCIMDCTASSVFLSCD